MKGNEYCDVACTWAADAGKLLDDVVVSRLESLVEEEERQDTIIVTILNILFLVEVFQCLQK